MQRLSNLEISRLAANGLLAPGAARRRAEVGMVHFGIGAFHRAHQALYTEAALQHSGGDWGICGVSLRSAAVRDQLQPQDGWYCSVERLGAEVQYQLVGAVREVLVAPEDPGAVLERLADPAVSVVTLTVTEKGYCLDGKGVLDAAHPDIIADLNRPVVPASLFGYLCAGLALRRQRGGGGLSIISCDNLSHNGRLLSAAMQIFSAELDPELARWIDDYCSFPETMVDKIVPATTPADLAAVAAHLQCHDEATVVGEPFRQWVIEDKFAGPVPPWNQVGAQFVSDVAPFEAMKLRLLNASHSCIAYLGCLAGWDTVADAMAVPALRQVVGDLMQLEVTPNLEVPPGFDVNQYQQQLLERFANPSLQHRTAQIAMDGSQKLPQRIMASLAGQLGNGGSIERLCLVLAAWVLFSREAARKGTLDDPLAAELAALYEQAGSQPEDYLRAILAWRSLVPAALANNERLQRTLLAQLIALHADVEAALTATNRGS
ncbi:mannitol dehydrogenase family protein [Halieaceae bacterium IMCC14734]|uniref:Mannitol dehydrogenase family protein n=1 Tax=Candidatus Litorirhabdus singularis TaxID=2518993 RepID=A0ABT3TCW6_9GAMM|nr:mannitol dehydrogenase family protein [Candidatus Litorirhabdus singularis]MCX2980124.1 mannitol dehydrogenase family protein [Candidatus Litorirhabdus singularis]